ncbi:MAG: SigB/SigF/SigG family RNA polymerase sigma factor [Clostridia bacterium]|mgnify:FL=1|nr:SigB/SigF/SigG family RNA polymerase sigma factor [Clostridia bacterium]MDY2714259.1 SigB/SigF/SigG family RNA polymerase sigma factor [Christensenellaceae bacterium]MDY3723932.1 SigB/SigF/SigG family RNA polymerase sigma factor [Christensenellaceae bacterium]
MLNAEETILYLRKAKAGDADAKEILLQNNVLLIKSIIKRFKNKGVDYDDLYQLGCVGFLKAIKNFDEKFGVVFSTYAVPMIIGEVKRFLRDDGTIKVSRMIKSQAILINRYIQSRNAENGETPTLDEISVALNMEREDVVLALDSAKMPLSLSGTIDDGSDDKKVELVDKLPSNEREDDMVDKILLRSMIEKLPERERKVIIMRYYRDNTQSEIAEALGVSQVQISRIENKIIKQFKSQI